MSKNVNISTNYALTAKDPKQRDLRGSLGAYTRRDSRASHRRFWIWSSTLWESTLWGSTLSSHRFWIWASTLWGSTLWGSTSRPPSTIHRFRIIVNTVVFASQALKSTGGKHSGGLLVPLYRFRIWTRTYLS